LKERYKVG